MRSTQSERKPSRIAGFPGHIASHRIALLTQTVSGRYSCLGEEAVCNFSGAEHRGRQAIIKMREAMWEHIARRDHHPERIFVGDDGTDVVVWGSADFTRKSGEVFRTTFFARLAFEDPDAAQLRMSSYEVVKRQ